MRLFLEFLLIGFLTWEGLQGQTEKQDTIHWRTFEEVVELSKEDPRKVMIDVYTSWCGWCKRLDATTLSNPKIIKYINRRFYAVKLDAEYQGSIWYNNREYKYVPSQTQKRGYHELAAILTKGDLSYPNIVFLDDNLTSIDVAPGYKTPKEMDKLLRYFGDNYFKTVSYNVFAKTYRSKVED